MNIITENNAGVMRRTSIEWSEFSWNPTTGCSRVGPGCCGPCYAEVMAHKLAGQYGYPTIEPFQIVLRPERLNKPLSLKTPHKIFVNSMSDLFHEGIPFEFIDRVFSVMLEAYWHDYQVLTKRTRRMQDYINQRFPNKPAPPHIWLGTSIELQEYMWRMNVLKEINAETRIVSFEPVLGELGILRLNGINWAIVGGESGDLNAEEKPRRMEIAWAQNIITQCRGQNVAVFMKQLGTVQAANLRLRHPKGGRWEEWPREFDGLKIREYPVIER